MSKRDINIRHKDKKRHGGRRYELISKYGYKCSDCGKESNEFDIIAHHVSGNNQDHENQVLLCRACHCRVHHSVEKKPLTREQIEEAIATSRNLFEACKRLGINRASLYAKRKKLGLLPSQDVKV
jgi:DNA-directed RNA polymerase subunit RPC12/RpoP